MALLRHRQRPVTAVTRPGCYIIPSRRKLGSRIYTTSGADHTVTLTGPGAKATVSFPVDAEKVYRVYFAIISSSGGVYTPIMGEDEQFAVVPGTFTNDANEDLTPVAVADAPQTYGFELHSKRGNTIHLENAAEADPGFSVTYGHFYAREVKL